jgi:hemolysin-activating ACP:hemolysin acyltransferase
MATKTASDGTTAPRKSAKTNGPSQPVSPVAEPGKNAAVNPREARHARMAQSFSQVVAVLMRDANFRNLRLADLEWLVLPAIMSGQFKLGHARAQPGADKSKDGGTFVPAAVAMWARVSPAIDKAMSENLDKPVRLKANQWMSGDIPWLIAVAGDQRIIPTFLKQLSEQEFKGKHVKMRARTPDGGVSLKTLG